MDGILMPRAEELRVLLEGRSVLGDSQVDRRSFLRCARRLRKWNRFHRQNADQHAPWWIVDAMAANDGDGWERGVQP
jgi:hypothetical protein